MGGPRATLRFQILIIHHWQAHEVLEVGHHLTRLFVQLNILFLSIKDNIN